MSGKYWDKAWSLVQGCTRVSPGCDHCWLLAMDPRFGTETAGVTFRIDRQDIPLKRKKPTVYAIWSDLFHEDIRAEDITLAFEVMEACKQHTFLVLTKRPERLDPVLYGEEGGWYLGGGDYLPNVFLMTTAENQYYAEKRIPELLKCKPFKLGLSLEPLLGPISLRLIPSALENLDWVIVGGESGPGARMMLDFWAEDIREECREAGIPFFMKQMSGRAKIPESLRLREFPQFMIDRIDVLEYHRRLEIY